MWASLIAFQVKWFFYSLRSTALPCLMRGLCSMFMQYYSNNMIPLLGNPLSRSIFSTTTELSYQSTTWTSGVLYMAGISRSMSLERTFQVSVHHISCQLESRCCCHFTLGAVCFWRFILVSFCCRNFDKPTLLALVSRARRPVWVGRAEATALETFSLIRSKT